MSAAQRALPSSAPDRSSLLTGAPACAAVAAVVFLAHLAFASTLGYPVPAVHDEFAYLLMGDTFAAGRLVNPTHPQWIHFESFHVFHQPVYQGKYPPGQGAFLALGQVLGGHPAVGVWLSMALGAGALSWMLAALVPRGWAALGSLLFALHFPVLLQWGQSYWGGAVALLGGALLFGGLARLSQGGRGAGWVMALGLLVLANSRPQEGLVAALLCLPALVLGHRHGTPRRELARRVALPLVLGLALLGAWALYYNWRLSGDPFVLPHDHWRARDAASPLVRAYEGSRERSLLGKLRVQQVFFVGGVLWLALPFLLPRLRSRAVRYAAFVVLVGSSYGVLTTRAYPHYLAPLAGPMVLLLVEALRGLAGLRAGAFPLGRAAVALLALAHLGLAARTVCVYAEDGPRARWALERQALLEQLQAGEGDHLVLVRYPPQHDLHQEWVYNAADIDAARVVWARDLGTEQNRGLLEHFAGRRVWTLVVAPPYRLAQVLPRAERGE